MHDMPAVLSVFFVEHLMLYRPAPRSEDELRSLFQTHVSVREVRVVLDKYTGARLAVSAWSRVRARML